MSKYICYGKTNHIKWAKEKMDALLAENKIMMPQHVKPMEDGPISKAQKITEIRKTNIIEEKTPEIKEIEIKENVSQEKNI